MDISNNFHQTRKRPLAQVLIKWKSESESESRTLRKHFAKAASIKSSTGFEVLPADVVLMIFSRLVPPVKSLLRCRAVSKFWCNLIDTPRLANMIQHLTEEPELLILSFPYLKRTKTTCVFSHKFTVRLVDANTCSSTSVGHPIPIAVFQNSCRYVVVALCHGLFCFSNLFRGGHAFLFNPLRGEALMLPQGRVLYDDDDVHQEFYGIGFDSTTSTYKVVRVHLRIPGWESDVSASSLAADVYTLGTSSWRPLSSVPPHRLIHEMPVSAYGDVHWMTTNSLPPGIAKGMIVTFDTKEEEFKMTPHPDFKYTEFNIFRLVDLRGSLAIINMGLGSHMVLWVLKDYAKKEWAIEYTIRLSMWVSRNLVYHESLPSAFAPNDVRHVGAWEHGLVFDLGYGNTFLYTREFSNCIWHFPNLPNTSIFSYSGGLISLKNYGKLMAKQVGLGNCFDLNTVGSVSACHSRKI